MITKVIFICALILLQNIFFINPVYATQEYIEVDKIIAIVETQTITNSELNKKKKSLLVKHNRNKGTLYSLIKKLQNYL
jgi:hypothetical protein